MNTRIPVIPKKSFVIRDHNGFYLGTFQAYFDTAAIRNFMATNEGAAYDRNKLSATIEFAKV